MHLRIALADDQDLVREGIKSLLALSGQVAVAVEARNGDELLSADLTGIDVVVLDIRMPGRDGLETLRELRRRGNPVPVLMLTTFDEPALFEAAVAAGARGYLRKDATPEALLSALQTLADGGSCLQPVSVSALPDQHRYAEPLSGSRPRFSQRELSILRLMAGGYSNREIAGMLFLAEGTVKNYVSDILVKLEARDRTQAVLKAIAARLL